MTARLAPADQVPDQPRGFGWRFLSPLLLGSTLNPINSSMIATGQVGIGLDFHRGPGETAALVSVLYLCSAVMQPTMGKLATLLGARRVFLVGTGILLVAGLIGSLAQNFESLLVSRALIGAGTAAAYPTAMSLVRARADELGSGVPARVLGNFSIASQVTAVIGLPLGGLLTGILGWRALFFVNVPLALLTLIFTLLGVDRDETAPRTRELSLLRSLDLPGIVLFALVIAGLLVFLSDLVTPQWWLVPGMVLTGAALVFWERRASSPLIDVRMLSLNRALQRSYLRQTLIALGIYTSLYGISQWMEQSAQLSASAVGLVLLPLSGLSIVIARVVSSRGWVRWPLALSGLAFLLAAAVMLVISGSVPVVVLVGMSLLLGCANGLSGFANQAVLYVQTTGEQIAVASGLYRTFTYLGAIFSASLIGLVFGKVATDAGFHTLAWVLAVLGLGVVLLSLLDRSIPAATAVETTH
ncbi:MFS transporter [Psychromicrobium xiongbiense]|uniref:MFS transporter n=1 Tax=Psychromicrobium xiongbiense TaxID=3051184 RepID=UPI0025528607|nr:MFS transporter [Psychromicrobium sp. YIM S02556]